MSCRWIKNDIICECFLINGCELRVTGFRKMIVAHIFVRDGTIFNEPDEIGSYVISRGNGVGLLLLF